MIKTNVRIFLIVCFCLLAFTACRHGEDLPLPSPEVETVQLIISVPNTAAGSRAIGDPGTAVDEGADWDQLAVILAYTDDSPVVLPGGSRVQVVWLSKEDFDKLPQYEDTRYKLLSVDAQLGSVYIYGVTYSSAAAGNPEADIMDCTNHTDVQALTISNDYASTADASTGANTIDYARFVSVATGYYKTATSGNQPAAFSIYQGGTGGVGSMPTMTLTRLATKLDIQWDAADAYDQGYTDVKVTGFNYNGKVFGRLFPDITGITISDNKEKSWEFYNTSEISQRNGRVYHYTFPDGVSVPSVKFNITAEKEGNEITGDGYTLNFQKALNQAAWYKVNATIRGINGAGNISLSMGNSGSQVGG